MFLRFFVFDVGQYGLQYIGTKIMFSEKTSMFFFKYVVADT
jgi:hypothetical protein